MSLIPSALALGPAKYILSPSSSPVTYYSAAKATFDVKIKEGEVNSDQYGQGIKNVMDVNPELTIRPQSLWSMLASVYPTALINPTIGSLLLGASAVPLQAHGEDSSLLVLPHAAQISLPSLTLGLDKGEFGDLKFGGAITPGKHLGESGSLPTYAATGGTYGTPSHPDYLAAGEWSVTWGSTVLTGVALREIKITPDLKIEPVTGGGVLRNWRVMGCQFSAELAFSDDLAARYALLTNDSSVVRGARNTTRGKDLVLTSSLGHTFTLVAAAFEDLQADYDLKQERNGPINFRTTGLTNARISWTTPD